MVVSAEYKPVFRAALGFNWRLVKSTRGRRIHILKPDSSKAAVCGLVDDGRLNSLRWNILLDSEIDKNGYQECAMCVKWYRDNVG